MEATRKRLTEARQLVLDLGREPAFAPDDFLVSPSNAEAFALVDRWPSWPTPLLVLTGPAGSGKSHLAAIWASHAKARVVKAGDSLDLQSLVGNSAVLLEDSDRASRPETDLFHLINSMREAGGWLMMTARSRPDQWGLGTADLLSRLRSGNIANIGPADPALVRAVLLKLFDDRQIKVEEDLIAYATLHIDRSLSAAVQFVAAIDEMSLAGNRRVTKLLAAETIRSLHLSECAEP